MALFSSLPDGHLSSTGGAPGVAVLAVLLLVFLPLPLEGASLRERIDESDPGDTIRLTADRYSGTVAIDKPLTLVGDSTPPLLVADKAPRVVRVRADSVTLRNLKIRGDAGRLDRDDSVVFIEESSGVTVRNCMIRARGFGIYVYAGGNNRIVGNKVLGTKTLEPSNRGNGIHLWKTTRNLVKGNRIRATRDGLYLSFAHRNRILSNRASNLRYGIHYMYSENNRLEGNQLRDNAGGIALMYSRDNKIEGNESVNNEEFGIQLLQLESSNLTENRVEGNRRGFFIENTVGGTLASNQIRNNHVGLYLSAGSTRNVLTQNSFVGNDVSVDLKMTRNNRWAWNGKGNYWEGYPGRDRDGDGIGEDPKPLSGLRDRLISDHPRAVLFLHSPIYRLAGFWFRRLQNPDLQRYDPHPLMAPPE